MFKIILKELVKIAMKVNTTLTAYHNHIEITTKTQKNYHSEPPDI